MKQITSLLAFAFLLLGAAAPARPAADELYKQFQDPPKKFSIIPYWSWVEDIKPDEVRSQIRKMADQHVYGAYVFGFDGLRTPYLSPQWMAGMRAGFEEGKKLGFMLGFITDHGWPQGDYRDIWNLDPPQSHVVRSNPEFMRRRLAFVEKDTSGPGAVEFSNLKNAKLAVAGRLGPDGAFQEDSLQVVAENIQGDQFRWQVPEGRWRVMVFCLEDHPMWRAYVDLMNREAVAKYIDMVLGEHYRQFGPYFGDVLTSVVSDHEGEFGYRIAWTPGLFDTFARMKGYRLEKYLPLLPYEGGKTTEKIRCDYLDVVAELYSVNYWGQVSEWLKPRGVLLTGHEWEESLLASAAYMGDFMRCQRHMAMPGIDSLFNWGESPRHFKETASVAHFLERPFWCENQILQGSRSFISPEKMRYGTNMVGVWGASVITPWFDYGKEIVDFPPVWDWRQPFWKYFHYYADYARRISFMNSGGRHVAPVLLYYPLTTIWAHSSPVFDEKKWNYGRRGRLRDPQDPDSLTIYDFGWKNQAEVTERYYSDLMERMAHAQWDFDVSDDYFLSQARIGRGEIQIGPETFRALVLPPLTTVRKSALGRIQEFYNQGGVVIATGSLPTISMEEGRNDPDVRRMVEQIFGSLAPGMEYAENRNPRGGRAYFVSKDLARVAEILERTVPKDFRVAEGDGEKLYYHHRVKDGTDFYWVVNNTPQRRIHRIDLGVKGRPELWDAASGAKSAVFHRNTEKGLQVRLVFEPWQAHYIVVAPTGETQPLQVVRTNLEEYYVEGLAVKGKAPADVDRFFLEARDGSKGYGGEAKVDGVAQPIALGEAGWRFRPLGEFIPAPYAKVAEDTDATGEAKGWQRQEFDDRAWKDQWLSAERFAITSWRVIGPFADSPHNGYNSKYGPELDWKALESGKPYTPSMEVDSYVTDVTRLLGNPGSGWVAYTVTFVHSPADQTVEMQIAADNAKVWVNRAQVLGFHEMPGYREDRAAFAHKKQVALRKGWNELVVKLERDRRMSFYFRLVGLDGSRLAGLTVSPDKSFPKAQARGPLWYRAAVPVSAAAVRLPRLDGGSAVYLNGTKQTVRNGEVQLPPLDWSKRNVLAVRVPAGELVGSLLFRPGTASYHLGSWTKTGLANYSGDASYEKQFEIGPQYKGKRLYLDCGEVGVAADVWVNGRKVGERVWKPFRVDITGAVRAGANNLKIIVSNTDASARAVANHRQLLKSIDLNGLLGPVRILPYMDVSFTLAER